MASPSTSSLPPPSEDSNISNVATTAAAAAEVLSGPPVPDIAAVVGARRGAAAVGTWSDYAPGTSSQPLKPQPALATMIKKKRSATAPERMDMAIRATTWIRLTLAILQGLLLFTAWTLSATQLPSVWTMSWQQRGLRKAMQQAEKKGWTLDTWVPVFKHARTVWISKAATALHQEPEWANIAAAAQYRPMLMLATANAVVILAAYLALLIFRVSSSKAPEAVSSPPMVWKVLTMFAPGIKERLAHVGAWQRVATSVVDSAVVMVLTLGCCELVPQMLK